MLRPLGLPPGSVRALLLIGLGVRAVLDLRRQFTIEPWLATALLVSAASYFSARSSARGIGAAALADGERARHPLFLPAGTIRTIVLVLVAYGAWLWYRHNEPDLRRVPIAWVLGAFALGVLLRWVLNRAKRPDDEGTGMFWHVQSLVALACATGLVAIGLGSAFPDLATWIEPMLASVVVFYFGTR